MNASNPNPSAKLIQLLAIELALEPDPELADRLLAQVEPERLQHLRRKLEAMEERREAAERVPQVEAAREDEEADPVVAHWARWLSSGGAERYASWEPRLPEGFRDLPGRWLAISEGDLVGPEASPAEVARRAVVLMPSPTAEELASAWGLEDVDPIAKADEVVAGLSFWLEVEPGTGGAR